VVLVGFFHPLSSPWRPCGDRIGSSRLPCVKLVSVADVPPRFAPALAFRPLRAKACLSGPLPVSLPTSWAFDMALTGKPAPWLERAHDLGWRPILRESMPVRLIPVQLSGPLFISPPFRLSWVWEVPPVTVRVSAWLNQKIRKITTCMCVCGWVCVFVCVCVGLWNRRSQCCLACRGSVFASC
jgi:hypothetical protein